MPGSADEWLARAATRVAAAEIGAQVREIGRVESIGDGVALVSGLAEARLDELLQFAGGQAGFVQTLDRDRIGCVMLEDADSIEERARHQPEVWPEWCWSIQLSAK